MRMWMRPPMVFAATRPFVRRRQLLLLTEAWARH
jgi:hypothetical protein